MTGRHRQKMKKIAATILVVFIVMNIAAASWTEAATPGGSLPENTGQKTEAPENTAKKSGSQTAAAQKTGSQKAAAQKAAAQKTAGQKAPAQKSAAGETSAGKTDAKKAAALRPYVDVISELEKKYGKLRVSDSTMRSDQFKVREADGVCCLALLNMDGEGARELLAVCKNEKEKDYKGFVYTIRNKKAERVLTIKQAACNDNNEDIYNLKLHRSGKKDVVIVAGYPDSETGDQTRTAYGCFDGSFKGRKFTTPVIREPVMEYGLRGDDSNVELELLGRTISDTVSEIRGRAAGYSIYPDPGWREAYKKYIQADKDVTEYTSYDMIYIDCDHVPEILISYGVEALGTRILSFQKGRVVDLLLPRLGGVRYHPFKDRLYNSVMHMGYGSDQVYNLDRTGFRLLGEGERNAVDEKSDSEFTYKWAGRTVTEKEYYSRIDELFDRGTSSMPEEYLPFDQNVICQVLSVSM